MRASLPSLHRKDLRAGTILFAAGEPGDAAYLVETGRLEIYVSRAEGDLVLAHRGPGEVVGEMALLDGGPRSACVRAVEASSLVVITHDQFSRRLTETDPILRMCLSVVLERYRETVALLAAGDGRVSAPRHGAPHVDARAHVADAIDTLRLEQDIRAGLARGEFTLFFQPIVRLDSGRLSGFEALMRWLHPERGLLPPSGFIPVAEAAGFIAELTACALSEVMRLYPAIARAGLSNPAGCETIPFAAVNISGRDLADPGFPDSVRSLAARAGIDPGHLKLEVTESSLIRDPGLTARALGELRAAGFGVAIDDFGTGYSSLSYLSTLPATTLKIDRAFVRTMLSDPASFRIVRTIIRLAEDLDLAVVAEGIEHACEADALRELGCAFGQGYLFGKPLAPDDAVRLAAVWSSLRTEGASRQTSGIVPGADRSGQLGGGAPAAIRAKRYAAQG